MHYKTTAVLAILVLFMGMTIPMVGADPLQVAQGGGHRHNNGNGNVNGNLSAVPGPKILDGYAASQAMVFGSVEKTAAGAVLHAKSEDGKDLTYQMMWPGVRYFNLAGASAPYGVLKPGQTLQAVFYMIDGHPRVVAFRDNDTVVIPQRKLHVYSANSSTEAVTMSDAGLHERVSFATDDAVLIDASGARVRFAAVKAGVDAEAVWKETPGKRTLILLMP